MTPDPLTVACPYCRAGAGDECCTYRDTLATRPHVRRGRLALALAAHADPALDEFFPPIGPCGICSVPGMPQRHRVIDGIAGMLEAGEDPDVVAEEYGTSPEAVAMVTLWMVRWPGAWL